MWISVGLVSQVWECLLYLIPTTEYHDFTLEQMSTSFIPGKFYLKLNSLEKIRRSSESCAMFSRYDFI
jgi:hypothetical protein